MNLKIRNGAQNNNQQHLIKYGKSLSTRQAMHNTHEYSRLRKLIEDGVEQTRNVGWMVYNEAV